MSLSQETHVLTHRMREGGRNYGGLQYFQGNFFHTLNLTGGLPGIIAYEIRKFMKENKALVAKDRASPDYLRMDQLADLQPGEVEIDEEGKHYILPDALARIRKIKLK